VAKAKNASKSDNIIINLRKCSSCQVVMRIYCANEWMNDLMSELTYYRWRCLCGNIGHWVHPTNLLPNKGRGNCCSVHNLKLMASHHSDGQR